MKINKKVSTLALGLALLLGIGAPIAVYAADCPVMQNHNPVGQIYVKTYTHTHSGRICTVTQTCTKGVCVYCGAVLGETCGSESHRLH
ncbi:MAG: hypothetical protein AB9856_03625 [Cellulosilyticaceae bacterium]